MATDIRAIALENKIVPGPAAGAMPRLDSVDLLRGIIMVVMALDHIRDFLTAVPFAPEDINRTWPALFLTRWVTHFCAPLFFFLAGTGAFLSMRRGRTPQQLSRYLWTRGLWLIFLELTVLAFGWTFVPTAQFAIVIWTLGWSMICMAAIVRLPLRWIAWFGVIMIAAHNLLDGIAPQQLGRFSWLWTFLHVPGLVWIIPNKLPFFMLYPLIPWVGVMAAGYAFGAVLLKAPLQRRRIMITTGLAAIVLFIGLRATNAYGNPHRPVAGAPGDFHVQSTVAMTIVSFLDTTKYPPSLQFLLMTLGPGLLMLALFDKYNDRLARGVAGPIVVFGRVPMFYYVLHIYAYHLAAIAVAYLWHQPVDWLWRGGFLLNRAPAGYGHSLPLIYAVWAIVTFILYWPCRWYADLKKRRRDLWYLSYL